MKKIFLLLSTVGLLWIAGCKNDDDAGSYIGTWIGQTETISNCKGSNINRNGTKQLKCEDSCYRLILGDDGNFSYQQGFDVQTGFWELDGKLKLCMEEEGEVLCDQYASQIAQGTLTLVSDSTSAGCISTILFFKEQPADTTSTGG
jgi:hypothetical protein